MSTNEATDPAMETDSRILVRILRAGGGLAVLVCLTACGAQDTPALGTSGSSTSNPVPTVLTCAHGEVDYAGALFAGSIPDGYKTRRAAVTAWLADAPQRFSRDYVISSDGRAAWLLRENGTAETRLRFFRHNGFAVYEYESCT